MYQIRYNVTFAYDTIIDTFVGSVIQYDLF